MNKNEKRKNFLPFFRFLVEKSVFFTVYIMDSMKKVDLCLTQATF